MKSFSLFVNKELQPALDKEPQPVVNKEPQPVVDKEPQPVVNKEPQSDVKEQPISENNQKAQLDPENNPQHPVPTVRLPLSEQITEIVQSEQAHTEESTIRGTVFDAKLRERLDSPEVIRLNTRRVAPATSYTTVTGETIRITPTGCTRIFPDPVIGDMWLPTKCPKNIKADQEIWPHSFS